MLDAVVVGAGPNGLAAAITLARVGRSVLVLEAGATPGGGCRTAELTLPGYLHDVCSAIHPLALVSPFLAGLDLSRHGLQFIQPPLPLAHPLDHGDVALLHRGVDATALGLGADGSAWRRLFAGPVEHATALSDELLGPLHIPRHPLILARFGFPALRSVAGLGRHRFGGEAAPALLAGMAAHSMLRMDQLGTAGFGMMLGVAGQSVGWPIARGGSQAIADALVAELTSHGGEIRCRRQVRRFADLPACRSVLFDTTAAQMVAIAGDRLPSAYRRRVSRFPRGPGVFKIDYALSDAIPWLAPECRQAGTVHVGGTLDEVAAAENAVANGRHPQKPFCLVAQQSLFDPTRAPEGRHTAWVYCHVPNGSTVDVSAAIDAQMERFAPGFRDTVLARHVTSPRDLETYNANYLGGDIGAGRQDLRHFFNRPVARLSPYTTPNRHIFICSASTPPGGGVHGMCGYHAARAALRTALR